MTLRQQLRFTAFFFLVHFVVSGQSGAGTIPTSKDSVVDVTHTEYQSQIRVQEKRRLEDSIRKAVLQEQLASSQTDSKGKEAILNQIVTLEKKGKEAAVREQKKIDSLKQTVRGYPVFGFFEDTVLTIYSRHGSFSAKERAEAVTKRIAELGEKFGFEKDSMKVVEAASASEITYGQTILMSIADDDAFWEHTSRQDLAKKYLDRISKAVTGYKSETSLGELLKEIGMALALIVFLFVIVFYLRKLFRWLDGKIRLQEGKWIRSFSVADYTMLDSGKLTRVVLFGSMLLRWMVIVVVIYVSLPILFAIFPWTSGLAEKLLSFFINPIKKIGRSVIDYLPDLFTIVVIVIVFRYVIKLLKYFRDEIQTGKLKINGFYPDWAAPTFQIVRVLLYAFMFTVIFPYLPGSDSPVFQGVSVFLGVLFTFGSSGSLSNIMSGLVLTYMRAFRIGDRVRIGDITGDVIEKSLLVTRIRTIKNEIISVPNSNVMGSHTINYSSDAPEKGLIVHTTVTIGYDVPWKKMYEALIEAAIRTNHILHQPEPFVLQTSLEDFYVSYQLNAYTREPGKQASIYSELHQNIQDCCNEAGIEIMSPHYRAGRDGSASTIPEAYLKNDSHQGNGNAV